MLELGEASKDQHSEVGIKVFFFKDRYCVYHWGRTVITDSNISKNIVHKHFKSKNF